jgi:DNA (cytosine-5)-methyltransferase 1
MGLDLGFEREGFQVRACVEKDRHAAETIKANGYAACLIPHDIHEVTTKELLAKAGLGIGETIVLTGAPPCEPFSTAGKRNGDQDRRADAIFEFVRVIKEARPQYFVFEEVPGLLSAANRHISFYERVVLNPDGLDPDERLGSFFPKVMAAFQETGYFLSCDLKTAKSSVLNAADFGTPQKRKRFILIGARVGGSVPWPVPTHCAPDLVEALSAPRGHWLNLRQGLEGLQDCTPECLQFPVTWSHYLESVPAGGCWRDLPTHLQREALGGAYDFPDNCATKGLKGGRTGFLRRLSWDRPSPTLVDRPNTRAGCLCHPDEVRTLSVREYARLQGFPDEWNFQGPLSARYRLIGQATPVPLAQAVAKVIKQRIEAYGRR